MPVCVTKSWRPALRAIARIQLRNKFLDWEFMWAKYTPAQRKAVRQLQRKLLLSAWPTVSDDFLEERGSQAQAPREEL